MENVGEIGHKSEPLTFPNSEKKDNLLVHKQDQQEATAPEKST